MRTLMTCMILLLILGCGSAPLVKETDAFREESLRQRSRVDLVMFQKESGEYSGYNAFWPIYSCHYDNSAEGYSRRFGLWPLLSWFRKDKKDQRTELNVVGIDSPLDDDPSSNIPISVYHWLSKGDKTHWAFLTPLVMDYRTNAEMGAFNLLGFGGLDFEGEGFFPFSVLYYTWAKDEKRLAVGTPFLFDVRCAPEKGSHFHLVGLDDVTGGYFDEPYPLAVLRIESKDGTTRGTVGCPFLFSCKSSEWGTAWNLVGLPFSLTKEEDPGDGTYISLLGYAKGPNADHLHLIWPLILFYENETRGRAVSRIFPIWNYTKRGGREALTIFPLLSSFETTPEGKFFRPLFFLRFKIRG